MRGSKLLVLSSTALASAVASCRPATPPTPPAVASPPPTTKTNDDEAPLSSPAPSSTPADLFYIAYPDGPFPSRPEEPGPRLIVYVGEPEDEERSTYAERLSEDGEMVTLDAHQAKDLGVPLVDEVWMFGPEGPCRATVGSAYAYAYFDGPLALELGYRLTACAPTFAPLAHVGASPPVARWREAKAEVWTDIDPPNQWKHETREALVELGLLEWEPEEGETRPPRVVVRVMRSGSIVELGYKHHWSGDECEEVENGASIVGRLEDGDFTAFPRIDEYSGWGELVGTLELDATPWAAITKDRFQMYVASLAADEVTWAEKRTGEYHDEDIAFSGWSELEGYCGP